VIYAFTPSGFSWSLVLIGSLLMLPWYLRRAAERRAVAPADRSAIPTWHPEYEPE
jgi:hypothetical protein